MNYQSVKTRGLIGLINLLAFTTLSGCKSVVQTGALGTTSGTTPTPTRTLSDKSTTVEAGYYDATTLPTVDADLVSSNIKAGITLFGVAGLSSVVDTASGDAVAGDLLSGKKAYVNGSLVTGTIITSSPTQSAVASGSENTDAVTSVSVLPSAGALFSGFIVSLGAQFKSTNICAGKTIFGRWGSALCPTASAAGNAFRSAAVTAQQEQEGGTCSDTTYKTRVSCEKSSDSNIWTPVKLTNEHYVIQWDDNEDGIMPRNSALREYISPTTVKTFPAGDCGTSGSIEVRAKNCNTMWVASIGVSAGGSNWVLITKKSGSEVWRDERTGLFWSDVVGIDDHCKATGDQDNFGYSCTANTQSFCVEAGTLTSAIAGENWASGTYSNTKGGMGKNSTNPVLWRLPTTQDFMAAAADGAIDALSSSGGSYWTASVDENVGVFAPRVSLNSDGYRHIAIDMQVRSNTYNVRCVGR